MIDDLRRRLAKEVRQALWGRLNKQRRSRLKVLRNLDWRRTIRANLKNYDRERKQIVLGALHFFSRVDHHMPWHIIMAVDCSGSMMDSVIHSAVMAGIFHGLPSLRVSLTAFDTAVVDLSEGSTIRRRCSCRCSWAAGPTSAGAFLLRNAGPHADPHDRRAGDRFLRRGRPGPHAGRHPPLVRVGRQGARPGRSGRRGAAGLRSRDGRAVRGGARKWPH